MVGRMGEKNIPSVGFTHKENLVKIVTCNNIFTRFLYLDIEFLVYSLL